MDAHSVHPEDIAHALQFDGRNQSNLVQVDSLPHCIQSVGGQSYRSADIVHSRGPEDFIVSGRMHLMNLQSVEENEYKELNFGQGHGLSLSLGSCVLSDMINPYRYKQKDPQGSVICSNYGTPREDLADVCGPARNMRNGHAFRESDTFSSTFHLNQSVHVAQDVASYTANIQNSRYLKATQQLLNEAVCVCDAAELISERKLKRNSSVEMLTLSAGRYLQARDWMNHEATADSVNYFSSEEKQNIQIRLTKLVALLDELESRYEQYFCRLGGLVSTFEVIAGTGAAASYTALTIQAMSKHFSNLQDMIIAQIHASKKSLSADSPGKHRALSNLEAFDQNSKQTSETVQRLGVAPVRQVWKPLRGLPENSVSILRAWLFERFLHPYPNENEKLMLAAKTGLTKNQISNWFINARVRLWKPMIEEMYREEFAEDSMESSS